VVVSTVVVGRVVVTTVVVGTVVVSTVVVGTVVVSTVVVGRVVVSSTCVVFNSSSAVGGAGVVTVQVACLRVTTSPLASQYVTTQTVLALFCHFLIVELRG